MRRAKQPAISFLVMITATMALIPLAMIVCGSFLTNEEAMFNIGGPLKNVSDGYVSWPLFPYFPTLKSFGELFLFSPEFFKMFWNSVVMTGSVLLAHFFLAVPAGWALGKYSFRGRTVIMIAVIVLLILPFQITMVSRYLVLSKLSLIDTPFAVILPECFATLPIFLIMQFSKSVPDSLMEAARIDGANEILIFVRIGLPLSKAGVMSMMVLDFLECWNSIEAPIAFLKDVKNWPLALYLPTIDADHAGECFAASVLMLLPALLIFFAGQNYLEQGIMTMGLKE